MSYPLKHATLYGIIDLGYVPPKALLSKAQALISGGVDLLQLRAKKQPLAEIEKWGHQLHSLCKEAGIPFIINDHPKIALKVKSDGLHIGQDDGTLAEMRDLVGQDMIIGRSTHSVEQARKALSEGFDYIGFGPLYPTPTKAGRNPIGLNLISTVETEIGSKIPVFCIGGIHPHNLQKVLESGAKRVVMVSALLAQENTTAITQSIKARLQRT